MTSFLIDYGQGFLQFLQKRVLFIIMIIIITIIYLSMNSCTCLILFIICHSVTLYLTGIHDTMMQFGFYLVSTGHLLFYYDLN